MCHIEKKIFRNDKLRFRHISYDGVSHKQIRCHIYGWRMSLWWFIALYVKNNTYEYIRLANEMRNVAFICHGLCARLANFYSGNIILNMPSLAWSAMIYMKII